MSLTRRRFGALTGATTLAVAAPDAAWGAVSKHKPTRVPKPKISAVEHVLRRTTYGATPELVEGVHQVGIEAWIDAQLHPSRISDTAMDELLTRWPSQKLNTWQVRAKYPFGDWDVMADLVDTHIARAIWSKRQLLELMVDFWSNHLNVTCPSSDVWDNRHLFDRDVIRKYAFGKFSDMLCATGKAPAMLQYLGNAESTFQAPNQNWGRELLELHTVGINAGYSQNDVVNSALILTGLSVEPDGGQYEYKPWLHYVGHVKVMGFSSANTSANKGEAVAMSYLQYLAHHPATATHLATKLAVRFVSDDPPKSLVTKLAETYRRNGTAILPVLKELFASKAFTESVGAKVRTPYEDFIATLRVLRIGAPASGTAAIRDLQYMTSGVGQPPLAWHAPNGYADTAAAWASTSATLGKWNAHMAFAGQWAATGLRYPLLASYLPRPFPSTYAGLVNGLAATLNVPTLNATQVAAVSAFVEHQPGDSLATTDPAVGWRLPYLIALILDSSHQAER